ncbi:hypothetical protein C5S29_04705, partial [ANME-1 cluster archaeon GoMg3.2]|nr:hypothetical protein [ANME-1 cluster archaeon GoMg3.2]
MLSVEHLPVLVVVISMLSSLTILIAGWRNKKSCCFIAFATILIQFIMSLFILHHVTTDGPIIY